IACAEILDAQLAVVSGQRDALDRVRALDSLMLGGPAAGDAASYAYLVVARLYERLGEPESALSAIRRRAYMTGWPRYLATAWREEGSLAERVGERDAARRAYARYLALRRAPEGPVALQVAEVRLAFGRLQGAGPR
ncbi:MAG TPA: hypothetical protein VFS05_12430, partial [Gemmatimonadaceae bacterium]|nr:hypothetical protein [Gemmatimonadaceae bacterium]